MSMQPQEVPDGGTARVRVSRPSLTVADRNSQYHYTPDPNPGLGKVAMVHVRSSWKCDLGWMWSCMQTRMPVLEWLPKYRPRASLLGDVIAGFTVTLFHIPQGMAYASMAGVSPITGLYMTFFPVLPYLLLGTSSHLSLGTFFIPCLMMGNVAGGIATFPEDLTTAANTTDVGAGGAGVKTYTPEEVVSTLAFMIGVFQLWLGFTKLGLETRKFLSDALFSGFGCSVSFHVLTTSLRDLLGLPVKRYFGPLKIFHTYIDIAENLLVANPAVLAISGLSLVALAVYNELIKPRLAKVSRVPIPVELLVMIAATIASYHLDLNDQYEVRVVGHTPAGFPTPSVPSFEILSRVAFIGFLMSNVIYTSNLRIARNLAKKNQYSIDFQQEYIALGVGQIFGSFFSCGPMAAFLPRSLLQDAMGCASLVGLAVCCCCMVVVLFFIAPLFETLPRCVLASITVVSLKPLLLNVRELPKLWRECKHDAFVWLATFVVIIITDVPFGLITGACVSVVVVAARSLYPSVSRLGHVPHTDLYLDVEKYDAAVEVLGARVVQLLGPLHFANVDHHRSCLMGSSGLLPPPAPASPPNQSNSEKCGGRRVREWVAGVERSVRVVVVDMARVTFVDASGGRFLKEVYDYLQKAEVKMCFAAPSDEVVNQMELCGVLKSIPQECLFHSTHDAITASLHPLQDIHEDHQSLESHTISLEDEQQPYEAHHEDGCETTQPQSRRTSRSSSLPRRPRHHSQGLVPFSPHGTFPRRRGHHNRSFHHDGADLAVIPYTSHSPHQIHSHDNPHTHSDSFPHTNSHSTPHTHSHNTPHIHRHSTPHIHRHSTPTTHSHNTPHIHRHNTTPTHDPHHNDIHNEPGPDLFLHADFRAQYVYQINESPLPRLTIPRARF